MPDKTQGLGFVHDTENLPAWIDLWTENFSPARQTGVSGVPYFVGAKGFMMMQAFLRNGRTRHFFGPFFRRISSPRVHAFSLSA